MRYDNRIFCVLICILLIALSAGCVKTSSTASQTQPVQDRTTVVPDTTAAVPEDVTDVEPTTSVLPARFTITPTKKGFRHAAEHFARRGFFGTDYDCQTDNILDYLYNGGL